MTKTLVGAFVNLRLVKILVKRQAVKLRVECGEDQEDALRLRRSDVENFDVSVFGVSPRPRIIFYLPPN
ncbi:hypothetical protein BZZ01_18530 [Nostocales cyanobacterium HT-58-2]|nr:hypothetical protein BZZ01_18530 [Nostocales cyanobacterium HT-58-2]